MDAVLVFDEAESLFGSRSDNMSSSTDRYAAMDVGGEHLPVNNGSVGFGGVILFCLSHICCLSALRTFLRHCPIER